MAGRRGMGRSRGLGAIRLRYRFGFRSRLAERFFGSPGVWRSWLEAALSPASAAAPAPAPAAAAGIQVMPGFGLVFSNRRFRRRRQDGADGCFFNLTKRSGQSFGFRFLRLAIASLCVPLAALALPSAVPLVGLAVVDLDGGRGVGRGFFELVRLFLVFELDEVGDVEEGIAFQAEVDKSRLHARQNARHAPVVNGTREGVLVFAFVIDFRELIVF